MSHRLHLDPSKLTLLTSSTLYPLLLHLSPSPNPDPTDLALRREALSALHSSLITLLSLKCLRDNNILALLSPSLSHSPSARTNPSSLPIIITRSSFGNALTALETGYLLQDTLVLIYAARLRRHHHPSGNKSNTLNLTHLTTHHIPLLCAFSALQVYIAHQREKGILLIVLLLLMNASTPLGTLRWYLVRFRQEGAKAWITGTTAAYLGVYGVCRVWLLWWMLKRWGALTGKGGALEGLRELRWECRVGMAGMGLVNTLWFVVGVGRFLRKYVVRGSGRSRKRD